MNNKNGLNMDPIDFKKIGKRIKEARNKKHMTQAQLAEALGCSNNHVSQMELGKDKVSLTKLIQISYLLDQNIINLLSDVVPVDYENNLMYTELGRKVAQLTPLKRQTLNSIADVLLIEQKIKGS